MKYHKKIKKRENKRYFFIADPMISSFKKPKLPLKIVKVKNPLKIDFNKNFIIEEIKQF